MSESVPERQAPVAPSHFETTDAEVGRDLLDQAYGASLRVHSPIGRMRMSRADVGAFAVDEIEFDASMSFDTDAVPALMVNEVRRGCAQYTRQRLTDQVASGDVFVSAGPGEGTRGRSSEFHVRSIGLGWEEVSATARELNGEDWGGTLRFERLVPASRTATMHWRRLLDYVEGLLTDDAMVAQPLVVGTATRLLAHTALATFPNNATGERRADELPRDHRDSTSQALQRAVAYIDAHAGGDVSLAEVATASRVSPRALQYAFRRHLGTTPMGYLRRVRLDQARRDLRTCRPGATVAEVAARWGFYNQGRFAALYRAAYGENPHRTLGRTRQ